MKTKSGSNGGGPKLAHGAILFGVALLVALGIGMLLHSGEPEAPAVARTRYTPPAETRARPTPVEPAVAAVAVETPVETATPAEPETLEPVTYAEAEAAYFAGDVEHAAALFGRYVEANPGNAWGHYMRGLTLRRARDLDGSEQAFLRALEIAPRHRKSLVNLARTLLDAGRADDALPFAERAIGIESPWGDAHRVHGRVLHTLGRSEEALAAYETALSIDPNDAWSLNNTGLILIETERFDDAAARLTRACEADSSVATFRNNLGVALERIGRYGEAREAFAGALEVDEGCEKARVSLARVEELADEVTPADPAPLPGAADVELAAGTDPEGPGGP